jgi:hypothetical protein
MADLAEALKWACADDDWHQAASLLETVSLLEARAGMEGRVIS